jgi:hypothetical protein
MGVTISPPGVAGSVSPAESVTAYGNVNAPGAGQSIFTTGALPAGLYEVFVSARLTGTLASPADFDNLMLNVNAVAKWELPAATTASLYFLSPRILVRVPANGTINVTAIGAATAGSVYRGGLTATQVGN